ncbi:MAG: C4-dicarboxylate ABC transporter, partial [Gammaproteobacteria bacterium]|nr:C4-dicarboxylate ABC transporter [Gammaproteobacteria bacterium]
MTEENAAQKPDDEKLKQMVADADTGGRSPGGLPQKIILGVALAWSLFQVWIASPLPFLDWPIVGSFGVFNDTEARSIHLAFAVFLAFLSYPALKRSPRHYIPIQDWVLAF